jgi:2-iminobutanoate/2-iminopropanoate deaminase
MSKREIRHPDKQVSTGAYSAGVLADGWLYVSGQIPVDMKTGAVSGATIEEQAKLVLDHIEKIVQAAGGGMADVVKCSVHLANIDEFPAFNKTYQEFFTGRNVTVLPARTTAQSGLFKNVKVEIDAVAKIG